MSKSFIIRKNDLKTSDWGGGKTTELFIYPKEATLKKSNFDFRLSTASIEEDKSIFTKLTGVHRKLLLLEGKLELEHLNHYSKKLKINELYEFEGGWDTNSIGKAIDFNLMTKKNYKSSINVFTLTKGAELSERNLSDYTFIYLFKGNVETTFGDVNEKDILVVNKNDLFDMRTKEITTLVHVSLTLFD